MHAGDGTHGRVDLVCHAGHELAQRRHLFGLDKLRLRGLELTVGPLQVVQRLGQLARFLQLLALVLHLLYQELLCHLMFPCDSLLLDGLLGQRLHLLELVLEITIGVGELPCQVN